MSPGLRFVLPALLIGAFACSDQSATAPRPPLQSLTLRAEGGLTVMTYNIYQGTELENSIAATTPQEFVIGATMDFLMMRQTNFAERSRALAAEIDASQPDLIGLQEVAVWRTGPHTDPAQRASNVEQDFLAMLLDALRARGLSYSVASSIDNFDVQGPAQLSPGVLTDVRLTDRDVILARADQSGASIKLSNPHASNFVTNLVIPTVAGPTTVLEGWASIDVRFRGRTMRFITTHLDANAPPIRLAQANEILNGPANTDLPVILAGDMNTTSTTDTYSAITAAGFSDVWARLHPADAGFTCCQTVSAINNPISALYQRVDLFLLRGHLEGESISRIGADPVSRTPSGLWPSDHAGLVATLEFEK